MRCVQDIVLGKVWNIVEVWVFDIQSICVGIIGEFNNIDRSCIKNVIWKIVVGGVGNFFF